MDISIGVWIMPNNNYNGTLENFVYNMIPPDDCICQVPEFIDNIPTECRKFNDNNIYKAYVHAWLATWNKPRPMGAAINSGDLDHNCPQANSFVSWLSRLFDLGFCNGKS